MRASRIALLALASALFAATGARSAAQPSPATASGATSAAKPNVLFIVIDDLNDWVGHLGGNPQSVTPNLDRIARRGVRFTRAYTAVPVCNASRAAVLSGMRPSTTGVYGNTIDWRPLIPEPLTLTAQFRKAGYWVAGVGKVPHYLREGDWDQYVRSPRPRRDPDGTTVGAGDTMPDQRRVTWLIEQLRAPRDRPFFLAIGLSKPHEPWNVPAEYYERYPLDSITLPPSRADDLEDVPPPGRHLARAPIRHDTPKSDFERIVEGGRWQESVRRYLAAIAFMDDQLGRLIDGLDASPYRDNTIVVVWSDNGLHLGEKLHWHKQTLWEEATRVPFVWIAPGVTRADGVCDRTVDLMSIYPTLMELTGLRTPDHVEGVSLRPLLAEPKAAWDRPALSTFHFKNHAVRTERWRYIRYLDGTEELYDESRDPNEWTNLASRPEMQKAKAELAAYFPKSDAPPGPDMQGAADDERNGLKLD